MCQMDNPDCFNCPYPDCTASAHDIQRQWKNGYKETTDQFLRDALYEYKEKRKRNKEDDRRRQERFIEAHPGYRTEQSRRFREKHPGYYTNARKDRSEYYRRYYQSRKENIRQAMQDV